MSMGEERKRVVWLAEEIKSPPFTPEGRVEAGNLLRQVQEGVTPPFPANRPMPSIGRRVHELRLGDAEHDWRLFYRIDDDFIVLIMIHEKRTRKTPKRVIDECKRRLKRYDAV